MGKMIANRSIIAQKTEDLETVLACTIVLTTKYHTAGTNLKRIITIELCVSAVYRINFCKRLL